MRGILEQMRIDKEQNGVLWRFYRGHTAPIARLFRDEWCLSNDFLVVSLSNGEVFIWNVSTAQLERGFVDAAVARQFQIDRGFAVADLLFFRCWRIADAVRRAAVLWLYRRLWLALRLCFLF